jgi:hypothetical protein
MDSYNLGDVQAMTDGHATHYGFNIIDVLGRPLLTFAFETQKEAEAVRIVVQPIISQASLIITHPS